MVTQVIHPVHSVAKPLHKSLEGLVGRLLLCGDLFLHVGAVAAFLVVWIVAKIHKSFVLFVRELKLLSLQLAVDQNYLLKLILLIIFDSFLLIFLKTAHSKIKLN
jgi:hypothetical protein